VSVINVSDLPDVSCALHVHKGTTLIQLPSASDVGAPDVALLRPRSGIDLVAKTPKGELLVASLPIGAHNVENLLGAIAIGVALDLPLSAISGFARRARPWPPRALRRSHDRRRDSSWSTTPTPPDALARVCSLPCAPSAPSSCVFGCGGDRTRRSGR
jgi:UDP-N-acetylmuramyl tripeptide synthase